MHFSICPVGTPARRGAQRLKRWLIIGVVLWLYMWFGLL